MKIAFLHPDLGIGGAERLIVDAAMGLIQEGHTVQVFTSHCDRTHCFEEISTDKLKVKVYADWLPTSLFGRFKIVFAALRQLILVLLMVVSGEVSEYDFFIVDQLSFCMPLLHMFHESRARILFYCHFPDQKLARHDSLLRKLYRLPFDMFEQFSMSAADAIVVNSGFTKSVYNDTFPYLREIKEPGIVYPCVDLTKLTIDETTETTYTNMLQNNKYFLSINRFEAKKNIDLAIDAYAQFLKTSKNKGVKLVITGGYDNLNNDNKVYLQHLERLTEERSLKFVTLFQKNYPETETELDYDVLFLPSIPSQLKEKLLANAELLLYTPPLEHFGIVPLEAMKFGIPTLAIDNGGPLETIISLDESDEGTGWLCPDDALQWSLKMNTALSLDGSKVKENGLKQVESKFTRKVMTESIERTMLQLFKRRYQRYSWENFVMLWKLPAFFILRQYFQLPAILVWILGAITFLPPGVFQLIGYITVTGVYLVEPDWFTFFD